MPTNDVVVRLAFEFKNLRSINAAEKRLQKLGILQDISRTKTTVFQDGVTTATQKLQAHGVVSSEVWNTQQKNVEKAATSISKYKSTAGGSMQVVERQSSKATQSINRLALASGRVRRAAWGFTMISMSMLGMFFSMMSFTSMLRSGFNLLVGPIMDLDKGIESVADAFIFNTLVGNDLTSQYGSLSNLISDKIVPAWTNLKALSGQLALAMLTVGTAIFSDDKFVRNISESIAVFAQRMADPEIQVAIKALIVSFAELLPKIAEGIPAFVKFLEAVTPLVPTLAKGAMMAAVLMPIFSVLNAVTLMVANAMWLLSTPLGALIIKKLALGAAVARITPILTGLGAVIAGITLPLWAWVAVIAAIISAVGYLAYKLGLLDGIIRKLTPAWEKLKGIGEGFGIGTASASPVNNVVSPSNTTVNQYVNVGSIAQEVDTDRLIDRLAMTTINRSSITR